MDELRPTIEEVADKVEGEKFNTECGVTICKPVEEAPAVTPLEEKETKQPPQEPPAEGDQKTIATEVVPKPENGLSAAVNPGEGDSTPVANIAASAAEATIETPPQEQADGDVKTSPEDVSDAKPVAVEDDSAAVSTTQVEEKMEEEEAKAAEETEMTTVDALDVATEEPAKEDASATAEVKPVTEEEVPASVAPAVPETAEPPPSESMEVDESPVAEPAPAIEAPLESSVVDLDTTLETSVEDAVKVVENSVATTETKSDVVDLIEEEDSPAKEPEVSTTAPPAAEEASSVMEVTLDEADKTLDTPNVSICPLGKPQMLTHNRISEMVLSNGSSTPNTSNPTSVEFQATPIKKPAVEEKEDTEVEDTKSTDASSSVQEISSKSSSDDGGIKRLLGTLKQVNGPTTECSSSGAECSGGSQVLEDKVQDVTPEDQLYDTVVNFQNGFLQCLLVERVVRPVVVPHVSGTEASDASSEKSASNGSATSLGPFALPGVLTNTASGLSVSSTSSLAPTGEKGRVQGVTGLRNFLQDLLKKLPEEKKKPAGRAARGRTSNSAPAATATTPVKAATPSRTAAAATTTATTPTNTTPSPKAAEAAAPSKKQVAFAASTESQVGNFVMARWTDKKYYAGRVAAEKPGNKFQVRFEDGAQKTLTRDQVVLGDKHVAAVLMNHEVNVLVEPNIYETGLVVAIDADALTYSVLTDSGTVTVPATDLYLDDEQAKAVQKAASGEAARETTPQASSTTTTAVSGRRKRNSDLIKSSPEAGPSGLAEPAAKKSRKRPQPPPPIQSCDSQLSDLSDTFDADPAKVPEISYVEAVDGVQPELSKCPIQAKIEETCGYRDYQDGDLLGGLPINRQLFRNKSFILTAPEVTHNPALDSFGNVPFDMERLVQQLRYGGATIYEHFEEIPKTKYKTCVLVTREPCLTARYIQCLAVNMTMVSHGWVIESCRQNKLMDLKMFTLPAGWSMVEEAYVRFVTGRSEKRANAHPFMNLTILISSENEEFIKFWTRVCKFADAKVAKPISSVLDISAGKRTYLLTDSELQVANVEKAKAVGIPIVSTAWISECLIQGRPVQPEDHPNFTKANWDLIS